MTVSHYVHAPIHFYKDSTGCNPISIEELVTIRHEAFYKDPNWKKKIHAKEFLIRLITEKLCT